MQFVLIPHYLAKRSRDEGWECEQSLRLRPAAKRQGFGGIPGADVSSLPCRVAFLQARQRFRRWILSTLQARREFIAMAAFTASNLRSCELISEVTTKLANCPAKR